MKDLFELNEIDQKLVMKKYMQDYSEPVSFREMKVTIPDNILLAFGCVGVCKKMKYVRIKKKEVEHIVRTIPCTYHCHKNSIMRLKSFGAENIYMLTSTPEPRKKVFNLNDFF